MNQLLYNRILHHLLADDDLSSPATNLIDAACQGPDALTAALHGNPPDRTEPGDATPTGPTESPAAYLSRIEVAGFRGIGPTARLSLDPGPGLTLVVGRNGSGKSSFSEAAEFALTGSSKRWEGRTPKREWRQGWRNLHHDGAPQIRLELVAEERGTLELTRQWSEGARKVDDHAVRGADLDELGWTEALTTFRPILSYNELGSMLEDGPTKLFDALEVILGLEELTEARERVRRVRIDGNKQRQKVRRAGRELVPELQELDDGRAARCAEAVDDWDLATLASVVLGEQDDQTDEQLRDLRALAGLEAPSDEAVLRSTDALQQARARTEDVAGTRAERDQRLATLLRQALAHHEAEGDGDCPVCGNEGALDASWHAQTEQMVADLEASAEAARQAQQALHEAVRQARTLLDQPVPPAVTRAGEHGLPTDAAEAWQRWRAGAGEDDPQALQEHLEDHLDPLQQAVGALRDAATEALEHRQGVWRPMAERLADWLGQAREVRDYETVREPVQEAEEWFKALEDRLRNERFAPVAERAQAIWSQLRQDSNVDLAELTLGGTATRRRVELGVTIDGTEGVALGVMSQGELHSLALSLFLPRATLPESPFGFLLIDDPVQSMDPHKVDGLAQVLQEVARTHQVVVFTHDARLPEALRRMQIPARIVAVSRSTGSALELEDQRDPIEQHLLDAGQILRDQDRVGRSVAARLVPLFCRHALEAAFERVIRRRRLARGESHADVEELIDGLKTHDLATLALFDDLKRGAEVLGHLNRRWDTWAGDVLQACKNAHTPHDGDLAALQQGTWDLAHDIAEVR